MAYIGVDISKNFFDCAYREDNQYRHARFDNNDNGFKNALAWAPQNGHWVMEATGPYYQRLAWYLDHETNAMCNDLTSHRHPYYQYQLSLVGF